MRYWKGTGPKAGQCGTMNDNGHVPDSIPASKETYEHWVAIQPIPQKVETDIERLVKHAKAKGWIP